MATVAERCDGEPKALIIQRRVQREVVQFCNLVTEGQHFDVLQQAKRSRTWDPSRLPRASEMPGESAAVVATKTTDVVKDTIPPTNSDASRPQNPEAVGALSTKKYNRHLANATKVWYVKFGDMKVQDGSIATYSNSSRTCLLSLFGVVTKETTRTWRRRVVESSCGGFARVLHPHALVEVDCVLFCGRHPQGLDQVDAAL